VEFSRIGPFEIINSLGSGPRGTVYRARHSSHGRIVAIKHLAASVAPEGPDFNRLWNEIARLRAVVSNHVVTTHSVEIFDGRPLIEMESLGESLEKVTNGHPLVLRDAMRAIHDVLSGLKVLHDAGIIHDNLKPSNVLQDTTTGSWKISDGGTTTIEGEASPTLLASSVLYVAPETVQRNSPPSEQSDLYCAGMLSLEVLLGSNRLREAFPQVPNIHSPSRFLAWLQDPVQEAAPLHQLRPEIPQAVSQFVSKLLAKDPAARFSSAFEATVELEAILLALTPATVEVDQPISAGEAPTISEMTQPPEEPTPWLVVTGPGGFNQKIDLSDRTYRIGRDSQNDIVLPDDSKTVSRIHAELRREGDRYTLIDLDSQNGLLVNGRRKPSVQLQPGVSVRVGAFTLMFTAPVAGQTLPPPVKRTPAGPGPASSTKTKPAVSSGAMTGIKDAAAALGSFVLAWWPPKNAQEWAAILLIPTLLLAILVWLVTRGPSTPPGARHDVVIARTPVAVPPPPPVSTSSETEKPKEDVPVGVAPPAPSPSVTPTPATAGRRGPDRSGTGAGRRGAAAEGPTKPGVEVIPEGPTDAEKLEQARTGNSFPRALQLLDEIRKSNPAHPGLVRTANQVGANAERARDRDTAGKLFKLVHDLGPNSAEAHELTAQGLKALREAREDATDDLLKSQAAEGFEKAIRYLPDGHPDKKDAQDRLKKLRGGLEIVLAH
jgi:serine/threonine protein kinase